MPSMAARWIGPSFFHHCSHGQQNHLWENCRPSSGLASLSSLASLEASMSSHGPPPGIVGSVSPTVGRYSRHGTCWSSIWVHLVLGPSGCSGGVGYLSQHHFGSMDTSIDAIKITFGIQTKNISKSSGPLVEPSLK